MRLSPAIQPPEKLITVRAFVDPDLEGLATVEIEVGRGLEGEIPDLKAHRIIDEQIVPRYVRRYSERVSA